MSNGKKVVTPHMMPMEDVDGKSKKKETNAVVLPEPESPVTKRVYRV